MRIKNTLINPFECIQPGHRPLPNPPAIAGGFGNLWKIENSNRYTTISIKVNVS